MPSLGDAGGRAPTTETGGSTATPGTMVPGTTAGTGGISETAGAPSEAFGGAGGSISAGGNLSVNGGACPTWPVNKDAAALGQLRFSDVTIKSYEHDCNWQLGKSVPLPVTAEHTRLLFHYDVNGDGIDDAFVGPNLARFPDPANATPHGPITLLLSKVDNSELTFESTSCELAPPLVDGTYALRDLDADGVSDFVIAVENGFRVVMNRESGLETTIAYDFTAATNPRLYLGDVTLGSFEKDVASELAIGFIRQTDNPRLTQTGTLLFRDPARASAKPPVVLASSAQVGPVFDTSFDPEIGIFTAVNDGHALFGATAESLWFYENSQRTTGLRMGGLYAGPSYLQSFTTIRELVFAGLGNIAVVFDARDPQQGTQLPMAFEHPFVMGRSHSYLLLDVDGDGDTDLMENQADAADTPAVALYNGDSRAGLSGDSHQFSPDRYRAPAADSPFLAVGAAKGRLLVSDAVPNDELNHPLSATPIRCGQ